MNYKIQQSAHYFHADDNEWPELLVEMARWLLETNACVESITFFDQIEDPSYVSATIHYSGKFTKKFDNPFILDDCRVSDLVDLLEHYRM